MSLGELPTRTSMRGYWKLENENDSSGNSRTLTNNNSVAFSSGRFTNASDYGSSGTNKGLTLTTSPMSAARVANITFSFWYKLNNTSSSNTNARFFELTTGNGVGAMINNCYYNISGGNITITAGQLTSGGTGAAVSSTYTANSNWFHVCIVKSSTLTFTIYINGVQVATNTGTGTEIGSPFTYRFTIGNARVLTVSAWSLIDEFILEERAWPASEIRKYYTQAKGRFCI